MHFKFQNRAQAGRFLADRLQAYAGREDVVVLGLPRGGIPVAFQVARKLDAPLAPFIVRKLGVPHHEELAMGAIAAGGARVLNWPLIESLGIPQPKINEVIERESRELARREELYRVAPVPELRGRILILIDDGLATGASMRAALAAAREHHPARIIVAAPVAARETCREFEAQADEVVCAQTPREFEGVGQWYEDFSQTTDDEVRALLAEGAKFRSPHSEAAPGNVLGRDTGKISEGL